MIKLDAMWEETHTTGKMIASPNLSIKSEHHLNYML